MNFIASEIGAPRTLHAASRIICQAAVKGLHAVFTELVHVYCMCVDALHQINLNSSYRHVVNLLRLNLKKGSDLNLNLGAKG